MAACREPFDDKNFYWFTRRSRQLAARCRDKATYGTVLEPLSARAGDFKRLLLDHIVVGAHGSQSQLHSSRDHIDPHVSSIGGLAHGVRRCGGSGRITALHDEIYPADIVERWTTAFADSHSLHLVRGRSDEFATLQLADLVAGATDLAFRPPLQVGLKADVQRLVRVEVQRWLAPDMTIWPWRDPNSQLRPEGGLPPRSDPDW